jgi:signal-transduction protein with cAMP-binding, CBS, and nucleotidyltransferase domain
MEITVSSIMFSKIIALSTTSTLREVAQKIIDEDAGSVLITENGVPVGIITEKDLLRAVLQHKDFGETRTGEVMSSPLDCCQAEDSLEKCMELFEQSGRTRLAVKREEQFVGIIRRKILERFLSTAKRYSLAGIAKTPRFRTGRG